MMLSDDAQATFDKAREESENGLVKIRAAAAELFTGDDSIIIGVNGSYARREVTQGSDVDLFFLFDKAELADVTAKQVAFRKVLEAANFKMPSPGGVFDAPLSVGALSQTIGGMEDNTKHITRRMLLLLEGEWIHNEEEFEETRLRLLTQYIPKDIRPDQICLFLLNDIIRYWRTICVDFEHKVQKENKDRAIRLIKLRFSRMMLFVAGVFAVSETYNLKRKDKLLRLNELLKLPPYKRLQEIVGVDANPALNLYAEFLHALDTEEIRDALSQPSPDGENTQEFATLREKAQEYRNCLLALIYQRCSDPNPTINALLL